MAVHLDVTDRASVDAMVTAVGVPTAVYLLSLWVLYVRVLRDRFHQLVVPVAMALIVGAIFTPAPVLAIGLVLAGLAAVKVALHVRDAARAEALTTVESLRLDRARRTDSTG